MPRKRRKAFRFSATGTIRGSIRRLWRISSWTKQRYTASRQPPGGLKQFAVFDWTDPDFVKGEDGRLARIAYHESINEMYAMLGTMKSEGKSIEEIARAVSAKRNEIRMASYEGKPDELAVMKARNLNSTVMRTAPCRGVV